jgi:predicted GNAT family acetyltransferase
MQAVLYDDMQAFRDRAQPLLLEREAENCIPLGILGSLQPVAKPPFMATVEHESQIVMAATMTPPYAIVLSPENAEAATCLANELRWRSIAVAGVQADPIVANAFADAWSKSNDITLRDDISLATYQLDRVNPLPAVPGAVRAATLDDVSILTQLVDAFAHEIGEPMADPAKHTHFLVTHERMFVWCDQAGMIVSMAAWASQTPNGVRLNHVYTPTALRGRGYASACVAALSQHLLDVGRRFVCLFADVENATSNGIYQRIGYRRVGQQHKIWFDPKQP